MQDLQQERWTLRVDFICSLCFGTLSVLCLVTIVFIKRVILDFEEFVPDDVVAVLSVCTKMRKLVVITK